MISTILCLTTRDEISIGVSDYIKVHDPGTQVRFANLNKIDGVLNGAKGIIAHITGQEQLDKIKATGLPFVNTSAVKDELIMPSVYVDDDKVVDQAVEHLLARGHREFACVGRSWEAFSRRRITLFEKKINASGFPCHVFYDDADLMVDPGRGRLMSWLSELPKPVGLFAVIDAVGMETITAIQEAGLSVPQDVAEVSVGDTRYMCEAVRPTMSSVRIPWKLLGFRATEMLYDQINGERIESAVRLLDPEGVIVRQSSDDFQVDDEMVREALHFIADHVHNQINVADVVEALPVSRRVFEVRFRDEVGHTPLQEIHRQRVKRAKDLLIRTDQSVKSIALQSGFTNKVRFADIFKRLVKMTPGQFRQRYRMQD